MNTEIKIKCKYFYNQDTLILSLDVERYNISKTHLKLTDDIQNNIPALIAVDVVCPDNIAELIKNDSEIIII